MKIVIVGAGIGGLTAAAALARNGNQVQVLERAPRPTPVGAGISMQANALYALETLGLSDAVKQRGSAADIAIVRRADGRLVRKFDFNSHVERFGALPTTIHRADLFDILSQAACEAGAEIKFDQELMSFEDSGTLVKVVTQRETFACDALVGADGIHSKVRGQLFGETPTRYSGYVAWRGIVTEQSLVDQVTTMNEIWGTGARAGYLRCSQNKVYWYATRTTADLDRPDDSWREWFQDWPSPLPELIRATPENDTVFNPICDRVPTFPWSQGRVTLLGDAAHPMTPNVGQGGAQAIEDAVVLSRLFADGKDPESTFRRYEHRRYDRTADMVNTARSIGNISQGGNWRTRWIRDYLLPWIPESSTEKMLARQLDAKPHLETVPIC